VSSSKTGLISDSPIVDRTLGVQEFGPCHCDLSDVGFSSAAKIG
jgi:hypothetical protein